MGKKKRVEYFKMLDADGKSYQIKKSEVEKKRAAGLTLDSSKQRRIQTKYGGQTVSAAEAYKQTSKGSAITDTDASVIDGRREVETDKAGERASGALNQLETFGQSAVNTLVPVLGAKFNNMLNDAVGESSDAQANRSENNTVANVTGTIAGLGVGLATGAGAPGLFAKAGSAAEAGVLAAAAGGGGGLIARGGAVLAQGVTEAALYSVADSASAAAIRNEPINVESIVAELPTAILTGAALTVATHGIIRGGAGIGRKLKNYKSALTKSNGKLSEAESALASATERQTNATTRLGKLTDEAALAKNTVHPEVTLAQKNIDDLIIKRKSFVGSSKLIDANAELALAQRELTLATSVKATRAATHKAQKAIRALKKSTTSSGGASHVLDAEDAISDAAYSHTIKIEKAIKHENLVPSNLNSETLELAQVVNPELKSSKAISAHLDKTSGDINKSLTRIGALDADGIVLLSNKVEEFDELLTLLEAPPDALFTKVLASKTKPNKLVNEAGEINELGQFLDHSNIGTHDPTNLKALWAEQKLALSGKTFSPIAKATDNVAGALEDVNAAKEMVAEARANLSAVKAVDASQKAELGLAKEELVAAKRSAAQAPMQNTGLGAAKAELANAKEQYKAAIKGLNSVRNTGAQAAPKGGISGLVDRVYDATLGRATKLLDYADRTTETIANGIGNFVDGKLVMRSSSVPTVTKLYGAVTFSANPKIKTNATRRENFERISEELIELVEDQDGLKTNIYNGTSDIAKVNPDLASSARAHMLEKANFLYSVLPRNPNVSPFAPDRWRPTETELDKFGVILRATEYPNALVEDLSSGSLRQETVETVMQLNPAIYGETSKQLIDKLLANKKPLAYGKMLQLGIYFGKPVDELTDGKFVMSMQANFEARAQEQEQGGNGGGQQQPAQPQPTQSQRIEGK